MKNECKLCVTIVLITGNLSAEQAQSIFHKNSIFELHSTVIVALLHERDFSIFINAQEWKNEKGKC